MVSKIRELAQQHCPRAIERLAELIDSPDERVAVAASTAMLDRGIGKPMQAVEVTSPDGSMSGSKLDLTVLSPEEFRIMQTLVLKANSNEKQGEN